MADYGDFWEGGRENTESLLWDSGLLNYMQQAYSPFAVKNNSKKSWGKLFLQLMQLHKGHLSGNAALDEGSEAWQGERVNRCRCQQKPGELSHEDMLGGSAPEEDPETSKLI